MLDLFSGIGGFSLGLERAGFRTVAFCEIDPYCRAVLAKHWPGVPCYHDIREVTRERIETDGLPRVDVITGGFPCQDISAAGKRAGIDGERSGLWAELARVIGEVRPRFAILENVANLLSGGGQWFGRVLGDLAEIGYDAEWHCIPAAAVGAPHRRDRVWIVAYAACERRGEGRTEPARIEGRHDIAGGGLSLSDTLGARLERFLARRAAAGTTDGPGDGRDSGGWPAEPDVGRVAHGIPARVDRLRGLGNAVVPQIPEIIGRALMEIEHEM